MFENKTPETILSDMLSGISQSYDTREGSVIYTALAPFAQELSALYGALDDILSNTFVDTADLAHLILRAKERGLTYIDATKAIVDVTLTFDTGADDIAVGDRFFTADGVVYIWQGAKDDTDSIYLMECAEAGTVGNIESGSLVYDGTATTVKTAQITGITQEGRDAETEDELRARYYESLNAAAFGGNPTDYKERARQIAGVGGVRVERPTIANNNFGVVTLYLLDNDYEPTDAPVSAVQELFDPNQDGNMTGNGIAPINHIVQVKQAQTVNIAIKLDVELASGVTTTSIQEAAESAVKDYIRSCAREWVENGETTIRQWRIIAALAALDGVTDARNVQINSTAANLSVSGAQCPVFASLELTEVNDT